MGSRTSLSSAISSYYLTVLVAFLMTAVIATPIASSDLSASRSEDTSGRADYWVTGVAGTTADNLGKFSSIAVEDDGTMHISHIDATGNSLKYSTNTTSSTWMSMNAGVGVVEGHTSIGIDSTGIVHIAFRAQNSTNSAIFDLYITSQNTAGGSSWSKNMIATGRDVGHYVSLSIDDGDTIHISHRDETNGRLRYATNESGQWSDDDVVPSTGGYTNGGFYSSIATDSNKNPFIVHCNSDSSTGSLQWLKYSPSSTTWSMYYPDGQGNGCKHASMDIFIPDPSVGGSDEIHISYARDENSDSEFELRYTTNKSNSWSGETIVEGGLGTTTDDGMTSIAVDSLGDVHIAYSGGSNSSSKLQYALKPSTQGSSWSTEVVYSNEAYWVSIDVDGNNLPHISFYYPIGADLYYAKLVQTGGGTPESVNSNPYYNGTTDLLMGAWNASNLVGGTDYNVTHQVFDSNSQLLGYYHYPWTQSTSSTEYEYNPPSGNPELTEGDTYCAKVTLYDDADGSQLATDETCVTIPFSESITSQLNFDEGAERLWANYSAAGLTNGSQYTVYFILTNSENMTISSGNQTINPAGLAWMGNFGSWPLNLSWMDIGSTYCMRYEVAHPGQSNYISFDESCVTIPSGSGSSEHITPYLNFDTASLNLTAEIDSTSLTIGDSYEVNYFLWQSEEGDDVLIDEGTESFNAVVYDHEVWDEWVLSSPENENGINRGETYCLVVKLYNDGTQVAADTSCVTIPSGGGGGSSWTMEVIESSRNEGFGSSMAIDDNGNIHVSYYDYDMTSDLEVRYGFFDGTDWYTETIASGLGDAGVHSTALDIDDAGCPVLLYYSEDARQLRIKYSTQNSNPPGTGTPCTWEGSTVVVATETSGTSWDVYALYSLAVEGAGSSLATHISYTFYCDECTNWNGDLMYASFDESEDTEWQFEIIATSSLTGFNSIKLGGGQPHIAYYDADAKIIYFTGRDGTTWQTAETVASNVDLRGSGSILSLDLGPNMLNTASVAYVEIELDAMDYTLKLAVRSGGSWPVTSIADTNGGADNSLAFDGNGNQNIAFTSGGENEEVDEQLRFAHFDGEEWTVVTIDNGGVGENRVGINPSLVYDGNGKPIVSYLDYTTGNLKFMCNGCSIFNGGSSGSGTDADGDGIQDSNDYCLDGNTGWTSNTNNDYDQDGCFDGNEDWDDDNDEIHDDDDSCYRGEIGWDSWQDEPVIDHDHDGCRDASEDDDDDDDGYTDLDDDCQFTRVGAIVDSNGCETSFPDDDDDGVSNSYDQCDNTPIGEDVDWYGCGLLYDDDNDGVDNGADDCDDTPDGEIVDEFGCTEEQQDDDGDGVENGEDDCPDTPEDTNVDIIGCALVNSIDEEADWWVEIPVVGVLIGQIQTEYGRYISMATVGLAALGWAYRAVTMRSDYKMEKRCKKFEKRIDRASSASELRDIQVEVEKAQKKRLILRGAYGDLLSRIEMRAEDLGLTDFITNDTLVEAGMSEMELHSGIEDLRAARMELDMARDDLERSRHGDSRSRDTKIRGATNLSDMVTGEALEGSGRGSMRRSSYHPMDINQDGVVDEEDDRLWNAMSEEERQARIAASKKQDVNLVSEIVAFSKIPNGPKARCNCGSGKQFSKCHMKKVRCPCGSGRLFIRCCAKKRGYR